jgi:hypothetical protein
MRNVLTGDVLFTVEPEDELKVETSLYREAIELLGSDQVKIVPYRNQDQILSFASASA